MRPGATRDAKIHRESSHSGEESTGPVPQLDPLDPMARALLANGIAARVGAMQPALQANTEDAVEWRRRISERLGARRLQVAELEVE